MHTVLESANLVRYGNPDILRTQEQDRQLRPRDPTGNLNILLIQHTHALKNTYMILEINKLCYDFYSIYRI